MKEKSQENAYKIDTDRSRMIDKHKLKIQNPSELKGC